MSMSLATARHPEEFCKAIVDIILWKENAPKNILILVIILLIAFGAIKFGEYIRNKKLDEKKQKLIVLGFSFVAALFMLFIINMVS